MRGCYVLDAGTKAEVEDAQSGGTRCFIPAAHWGSPNSSDAERAMFLQPVRQRLVRIHPPGDGTEIAVFVKCISGTIIGWPTPEARAFIRDLTEHATQPQFLQKLAMFGNNTIW